MTSFRWRAWGRVRVWLDLTRESDDTSLGAELLDEIYPGGDAKGESGIGSASGIFVEQAGSADSSGPSGLENVAAQASAPVVVADVGEARDGSSGMFGGLAFGIRCWCSVVTVIIGRFASSTGLRRAGCR